MSENDKIRTYDVRKLYQAFEILKAAGTLEQFLSDCDDKDVKITMDLPTAIKIKEDLNDVWQEVNQNHGDMIAKLLGAAPNLYIGRGRCPLCPE